MRKTIKRKKKEKKRKKPKYSKVFGSRRYGMVPLWAVRSTGGAILYCLDVYTVPFAPV